MPALLRQRSWLRFYSSTIRSWWVPYRGSPLSGEETAPRLQVLAYLFGYLSARHCSPTSRYSEQSPHSAHLLASRREEAALLPALLFQRSQVPLYCSNFRSSSRLRSVEWSSHSAHPLTALRGAAALLPTPSLQRLWVQVFRSTRYSLTRLSSSKQRPHNASLLASM